LNFLFLNNKCDEGIMNGKIDKCMPNEYIPVILSDLKEYIQAITDELEAAYKQDYMLKIKC